MAELYDSNAHDINGLLRNKKKRSVPFWNWSHKYLTMILRTADMNDDANEVFKSDLYSETTPACETTVTNRTSWRFSSVQMNTTILRIDVTYFSCVVWLL
jgi:hypothetical protein